MWLLVVSCGEFASIDASMSCLSHAFVSSISVVGVAQDVTDDRRHANELRSMQYLQASQEAKVETERNMTGTSRLYRPLRTRRILDLSETLTVPLSISQLFHLSLFRSRTTQSFACN
jgi:hypothetical protein